MLGEPTEDDTAGGEDLLAEDDDHSQSQEEPIGGNVERRPHGVMRYAALLATA